MMRSCFRNNPILFLFLVALGLSSAPMTSRADDSDDPSINDVQEFSIDGLSVLLRESKEAPTVSAILYINGGTSVMSASELASSEYFAMKLIPESGTELTSKSYFRRKMQRIGAGIGASDGRDYSAISMRSTKETFDTTWKFFSEMIVHPAVDRKEFDNLQRNALLSIQSGRNNPDALTKIVIDSIYFEGHPYGKRMTKENISAQTPENILRYYKSLMVKSRLLLVVVGSISRSELEKKLRASGITSLPQGNFVLPAIPPPAKAFSPGAYFPAIDRKLPTNYVLCYHRIPSKGDSDYYAYVRVRNFMGGFLFQHLRVQTNLAYAPNNDDLDWRDAVETISFQTPYVDSAIKIFYKDVDFFQNNMILESAIKSGVPKWAVSSYMKQETTIEQAGQIGQAQLQTGSWRNAFISFDKLANVTPEQILHVARTYYKNFNWCVVGNTEGIDKKLLESR
jgi:predicted Zn-dependent peptidase